MEVHQGWDANGKKVTVIRVSNNIANYWSAWDSSMANPTTQHEAQQAFGSMLTCARKVVRGFGTGTPLEAGCVTAPIRNLYAWHSTCDRFVKTRRVQLRTARFKIPSPADYQGTQTVSFSEQAVAAVDMLIRQLWHFVESRTEPPDDQVQAASTRGDKINLKPIHADDLLTLVSSELALLQWNTIELSGGAAGVTSKADADEHIPDAEKLPFGLQRCDVPQTLKRDGFTKAVTIKNADHWKLMEALMTAFPNAVSEPKLKHIFQGPSDRDNYSRALKNSIDTLGLTIERWALTAMK